MRIGGYRKSRRKPRRQADYRYRCGEWERAGINKLIKFPLASFKGTDSSSLTGTTHLRASQPVEAGDWPWSPAWASVLLDLLIWSLQDGTSGWQDSGGRRAGLKSNFALCRCFVEIAKETNGV